MSLTTQWSQIECLRGTAPASSWAWFIDRYGGFVREALRRLIWSSAPAAQAAEEFWGYLFASGAIERLDRPVRFRAFLGATLRNYARHWMRRNPRRGDTGDFDTIADGRVPLPEDEELALWAHEVLHLALQRLAREQPRQAEAIRSFYGLADSSTAAPPGPTPVPVLVQRLGCTPNALHQVLFRARARLHDCLVEEVRQTVSTEQDLEAEIDVLLAAVDRASPGLTGPATGEPG